MFLSDSVVMQNNKHVVVKFQIYTKKNILSMK